MRGSVTVDFNGKQIKPARNGVFNTLSRGSKWHITMGISGGASLRNSRLSRLAASFGVACSLAS